MAEERGRRRPPERPEEEQQDTPPPAPPKKKKKAGKGTFLFILLLLGLGVGAGLHFSGRWDARPLVWGIVPQIPYVGRPLADFFQIPEQYTLTAEARRVYELEEWQRRLDERERLLAELQAASEDVVPLVAQTPPAPPEPEPVVPLNADEEKQVADLRKAVQEMSSRKAAQILQEMREALAVDIVKGLPTESRASVLGNMDPAKAARLMELLALTP